MGQHTDQKIKNILKDIRVARERSEKFIAKQVKPGQPVVPIDLFEMAMAYDDEERQLLYLELALSEKYPEQYSKEQVEKIKIRIAKLTRDIRAWQNRQFPSHYRE